MFNKASRPGVVPEGYEPKDYPCVGMTVDLCIFTVRMGQLAVLLVRRAHEPFEGTWALPGGFVGEDEDATDAAWRELSEETGVSHDDFEGHLEQLATYSTPHRDPRMRTVSIAHVALAPNLPDPVAGDDASEAKFWTVEDLMDAEGPELAFDHADILADGLERVRSKLEYTTLAAAFVTEPFTLAELRNVYTAVWGTPPELANFRRKVLSTDGFVEPLDERTSQPGGGPRALLFRRGPATMIQPAMQRPTGTEDDED